MPFIAKGFNRDIGWGVTVNKPDLVDVYKLTETDGGYVLDGETRALTNAASG